MLNQLFKNKKGQNTAEYALLIALVVAGVIAMQTYAQRSLQARMRDASSFMSASTDFGGNGQYTSNQYEPYYMQTNYAVNSDSTSTKRLADGTTAYDAASNRDRTGSEKSTYAGSSGAKQDSSGI